MRNRLKKRIKPQWTKLKLSQAGQCRAVLGKHAVVTDHSIVRGTGGRAYVASVTGFPERT